MNTGRWLLVEELQNTVYRIFSDSQKHPFQDVFQYRCSQEFRNIHRKTFVSRSLFKRYTSRFTNSFNRLLRYALFNCSLKNFCSRGPVAFPESHFQCVTASLRLPLNQKPPPPPLPPSPPP